MLENGSGEIILNLYQRCMVILTLFHGCIDGSQKLESYFGHLAGKPIQPLIP